MMNKRKLYIVNTISTYQIHTKLYQKTYVQHKMNEFTLTKQISKQGAQSIIIIPTFLKDRLKPKTLVEIKIKVLDDIAESTQ